MKTYEVVETPYGEVIKLIENEVITWIPTDPANSDYQAYLEELAKAKK
jgi:hypothetical protein